MVASDLSVTRRNGLAAISVILLVMSYAIYRDNFDGSSSLAPRTKKGNGEAKILSASTVDVAAVVSKLENCTVSVPPLVATDEREQKVGKKIMWAPSYPDTISTTFFKNILSAITPLRKASKNYYAQSGDSKKCRSQSTMTAFCTMSHPVVPLNLENSKFDSHFDERVLHILRHPLTIFPLHHNSKAKRYHNVEGQVSEGAWRRNRNTYFDGMMRQWSHAVHTWRNISRYHVTMYLPTEYMMDPDKGPTTLRHLANVLKEGGYPTILDAYDGAAGPLDNQYNNHTADDENALQQQEGDFECLWYRAVGRQRLEQFHKFGYEYTNYTPGYTPAQRDLMLQELQDLMNYYRDVAPQLTDILQFYYNHARDFTRLDKG